MAKEVYWDGVKWVEVGSSGGSGGTSNYNELSNRPQINGVTLSGNKTTAQLGINGFNPVELWTHSPTTQMDGSALTLDMSGYDFFLVEFATNTADTPSTYRQSIVVRKGFYNKCSILYSTYLYWRMVYIYNDGVSFTNGNRTALSTGTNTEGTGYCIPVKIYGLG